MPSTVLGAPADTIRVSFDCSPPVTGELFAPAASLNRVAAPTLVSALSIRVVVSVCLVGLFVVGGYWFSDDRFFARLIAEQHIATPEEAFLFVRDHTAYPPDGMRVVTRRTPRRMLTAQKFLFCDQSAIVLATLLHRLGYETSLIDLHGPDGPSHHTVLGVRDGGSWVVYDVMNNLQRRPLPESAKYHGGAPYTARAVYRPYPRFYQSAMRDNVFVQSIALWFQSLRPLI